MVKVKNKMLIALSVLLCTVLFSGVFMFTNNTNQLNAEAETQSQNKTTAQDEIKVMAEAGIVNFPTDWVSQVGVLQGYTFSSGDELLDYAMTLTSIIFAKEVPQGYILVKENDSTISDGLPVYQKDGDSTKIAFVYSGTIKAPTDCTGLFGRNGGTSNALINLSTLQFEDNFDVSEVTTIQGMFACFGLNPLTKLDIIGFEKLNFTTKLQDMSFLFWMRNDYDFTINLSKINTSGVTNMVSMFSGCQNLTSIDVSNFDTSKVTNMSAMFNACTNLKSINFGSFNTNNVTDMSSMFSSCSSLEQIDLSNMTNCTSSVTDMSDMFNGCSNLKSVKFSDNFIVNDLTDMNNLFRNCGSLTSIDLSGIKFSANLEDASGLFYNCTSLKTVNLSGWDLSNTDTSNMFKLLGKVDGVARTSSLTKVILPSAVADDIELPTSWSTELTNKGATKYCITTDETKTAVTTIDSTLLENYAGGTLELYTDSGESLATPQTPVEPATGVNASVVAIVCSVIAILMIVVAYVVISNKKNNKRKVNAININISKKN